MTLKAVDKESVIREIKELIAEGEKTILPTKWVPYGVLGARSMVNNKLYANWYVRCISLLQSNIEQTNEFCIKFSKYEEHYYSNAVEAVSVLSGLVEYIEKGIVAINMTGGASPETELRRIMERFHKVARQLRNRHAARNTLEVEDEYDVQDLLRALLLLHFDDVRPEEWTPSYMGKSARMDFLLKNEKIVIEVKKTRVGLTEKTIGDQLIVDVERYQGHPDCDKLICFVYDPEARIGNPIGLISDFKNRYNGFAEIVVCPQ